MNEQSLKQLTGSCLEILSQALLSLLLLVLVVGMGFGVVRSALDLLTAAGGVIHHDGLHDALRQLVSNVLMVLAVVELFRTVKVYFSEGRVKVTYVIDTVLVVVITELMGFWYRDVELPRVGVAIALVAVLMGVRIMAIRFSPRRSELLDGL